MPEVFELKKTASQMVDGSPAQIWTELSMLAVEIFGSNDAPSEWGAKFVSLNDTADSIELDRGIMTPSAECSRDTHTRTHTRTIV